MAAAGFPESRVRVILTRGAGKLDLDPASVDDTQLVVIVFPLGAPTPEMFEKGVAVAIVSITRNSPLAMDPMVKSGNYLNNVLALGEARRRNKAYEAILCGGDGSIAEGSTSNIFMVTGGEVRTPPPEAGILDGITRGKVMRALPRQRDPARRSGASPRTSCAAPTRRSSPAPRAASCRSPPSTKNRWPPGIPGPVTRKLIGLYDALARRGVD